VAEVTFNFEYESSRAPVAIASSIRQNLLCEGVNTATGLAGANRSEDGNAGIKSAIGNGQPMRLLGGFRALGMM